MTERSTGLLFSVLCLIGVGCTAAPDALPPCDADAPDRPICGLTNPEDLGFLPDQSWMVVSEMAPSAAAGDGEDAVASSGRLTAIRLLDLERRPLFPGSPEASPESTAVAWATPSDVRPGWGDDACPGPPDANAFSPHGLDVGKASDGRAALAVVNHGGREAIELFEIVDGRTPALAWRGCVPMWPGVLANDVAFLPDGGFVVTNFMPALEGFGPAAIWAVMKVGIGAVTGSVLRWTPGGELTEIANSEGSAPNGVEASADGTEIFVAEWGGERLYRLRLDVPGEPRRDEVVLDHRPDNLTWTRDGRLLVTGQHGGVLAAMGCGRIRDAGCDLGYSIYVVGPVGLEATKVVEGRGAASVALEVGGELFVGAFIGDQIMRMPAPE